MLWKLKSCGARLWKRNFGSWRRSWLRATFSLRILGARKKCRMSGNAGRGSGRCWVVERVPASLLAALADLVKWLDAARVPAMVIGGVATSVLGRARMTRDVDAVALLPEAKWEEALSIAPNYGIVA